MDWIIEALKVILLGIVEGITEWLPVSSTGHMILVEAFWPLKLSAQFRSLFLVVIQLGAILAVILIYWQKLWPFARPSAGYIKRDSWRLWFRILVASVPAGVVGVLLEDTFDKYFYNAWTVAIMLILVGVVFILVESRHSTGAQARFTDAGSLPYSVAFWIGCFQLIAAALPGTSRSGATIIGALLLGVSRAAATEFTFYLAVPAMLGASLLKLLKLGFHWSAGEWALLGLGFVVAFLVSWPCIRFLVGYVRKHDFKVFGYYRIAVGLLFFLLAWLIPGLVK